MTLKSLFVITIVAGVAHCALMSSQLLDAGDFDSQIDYILDAVKITPQAMKNITQVYKDVARIMHQLWPESETKPFGATASGLGTISSDVDCLIDLQNTKLTVEERAEMAKSFLETQELFTNIQAVVTPTETFLQCQHVPTKQHADLTFTKPGCVRETALIRYYLKMDKRVSDLTMIVKYWAKAHRLVGLYWMPSFSIVMQVLFYLQQVNIITSVIELQKNSESVLVNNWETGYNENLEYHTDNTDTVCQLLGGFFKYYSTFDYDTYIVSPYVGRPVRRDLFENIDSVPNEFQLYKHNVRSKITNALNLNASMVIQDPFEHNNNSGEYVCLETVERVVAHFQYAAKMFEQSTSSEFLTSILGYDVRLDSLIDKETSCWS